MMEFRIADTFTDSLTRLTGEEQKAVKTAAFDLQRNPASPGLSLHRLDKAKDKNFWSVRVGSDIRLIIHKATSSFLLCYVGHHDKAYAWAERLKLETHPRTGAAQLVEIRERVAEITVPVYVETSQPKPSQPPLFAHLSDEVLLSYGVPVEWLADVRKATEDTILPLSDHLPSEAAEALLELATGGKPQVPQPVPAGINPFTHPDALRRFRVMNDVEELERAFTYPWEKWTIFLHPAQRELVQRDYSGPARVSGSAGTGKTIVALHRAVFLARANPDTRVLLSTFSETLANALRTKLRRLISNEPGLAERLEVHAMNAIGERLYEQHFGRPKIASPEVIRRFMAEAAAKVAEFKFSLSFLLSEWEELYRTSHQIRMQTDRLLGPGVADVDGNTEERRGTVSVFNGPAPVVRTFNSEEEENEAVCAWMGERSREGVMPHEFGVFVRSDAELDRARAAVTKAGLPSKMLDEHVETTSGQISIGTMHLAKGLEFRSVVVMACDDEIIPLQSRIETVADDTDLEEVYNTERHLLYVACTRARDHLLVTGVEPGSEFLDDLQILAS
jgi:mRNA-degrading endonuclease RelE of RelBE toxin-antitoxin system